MPKFLFGLRGGALTVAQLLTVVLPAFVLFGYNQSGMGGLVNLPDFAHTFTTIDTIDAKGELKAQRATIQGLVVAVFTLGALPGCLSVSWTADRFGRRPVIFAGALLTLIGEILEASAFQLPQLIIGRFILGAGVGMLSGTVPTWQSECSNSKNRGKHVVLDGCFISLGYILEAWINLGFYQFKTGPITWRAPIAIACFFSLVLMSTVFFLPESPRWLMLKGRRTDAAYTLAALRGLPEDAPEVTSELDYVEVSLEQATISAASFTDMFKMGEDKLLYRFLLCIVLQFFQQMCGSNLISVYSTVIFQQGLALGPETSRILSGGCLTWKFLSCFVAFFTIDRFGRRAVFMFSGVGMSACMTGLAVATSFPRSDLAAQIVSVLFIFLFNFFIPIGFLGANFLYATEIAPVRLRVAMASISTANHWLWYVLQFRALAISVTDISQELCRDHDHSCCHRDHRIQILHRLRCHWSLYPSFHLLLLPGDNGSQARGYRHDL